MSSPRRPRIHPYLRPELRERLAKYCAATRTTESAVVAESLDQFLTGTSDLSLFLRRFDRLSSRQDRTLSSLELLSQAFATFLRMWLAHTPRIPAELRSQAQASADARYRMFMERLSEQVSGGKRFIDDLPQEPIADNEELEAIARRASDEVAAAVRTPPPNGSDEGGGSKPAR
ncbi:MAG TPA: hypothetical protein VEK07_08430 [Polyangiaceae bacterium]|nr:hypothetical protein [Polyangiaceae bacterium]